MKCFKTAVISCALMASIVSKPAHSVAGGALAVSGAVVAGVAVLAVSAVGAFGSYRLIKSGKTALGIVTGVLSLGTGFMGYVILDGEQQAQFADLSSEEAQILGVSESDREIYNSEVEQVNAIAREIGSELTKQNAISPELAREMWVELGTELSPETMKTVIAIAQQG